MFARDDRGTVIVLFALLLVPLVTLLALALDVGNAYRQRNKMQGALDGAALAAGRAAQLSTGDSAKVNAAAQAYFKQHAPAGATVTVTSSDRNATVLLTGAYSMPTNFTRVLKINQFQIASVAKATITQASSQGRNIEAVLVLDVSASMQGSHITALKQAASDFVSITTWVDQSVFTSKVGVVPFASSVSVPPDFRALTALPANLLPNVAANCVSRRADQTDAYPFGGYRNPAFPGQFAPYTFYISENSGTHFCNHTSRTSVPDITRLTTDTNALQHDIGLLTANGDSDAETGMKVAFGMLNPDWAWGAANYDSTKTRKMLVLISDANWLVTSAGGSFLQTPDIATVCTNMKAKGVEIFTVYYPTDSTRGNRMKACATDAAHFYDATLSGNANDAVLAAAARDIALKISTLRLTQ